MNNKQIEEFNFPLNTLSTALGVNNIDKVLDALDNGACSMIVTAFLHKEKGVQWVLKF